MNHKLEQIMNLDVQNRIILESTWIRNIKQFNQ